MKNQYIGDIGDYGKYGILRFFASQGINVGLNWYLTPDDGRTDGNHTEYLSDERMRVYDTDVYDAMKKLAFMPDKNIELIEQDGILDGMIFYNSMMDFEPLHWSKRLESRNKWHFNALNVLKDADLIFADPDNSLTVSKKPTQKDTQKFILPNEVSDYFRRGQDVVYYHHRSRKNETGWMEEKRQMKRYLPEAHLLAVAFRRWSLRVYIFVIHSDKLDFYKKAVTDFLGTSWGKERVDGKVPFTLEDI